jgi:hypothetical protein
MIYQKTKTNGEKTRKSLIAIGCLLAIMLMAVACSTTPEKALLGKWVDKEKDSIEFKNDGTGSLVSDFLPFDFKWFVLDKESVRIVYANPFGEDITEVQKFKIAGNALTLTSEDGTVTEYTKVKD